ncbi:RNA polymerase sigma factor [bacterium AH-315-J04]|nr:RNA polymerase sigma factor [bacterium AH-315-J04]
MLRIPANIERKGNKRLATGFFQSFCVTYSCFRSILSEMPVTQLENLYRRYANEVYRFSLWLSGDPVEADDLVSETFLRAWTSTADLHASTVKAYLFTVARNVFRSRMKRSRRHTDIKTDVEDSGQRPATVVEANEELRVTMNAMQQLPEIDRAALLLRAQHGLPYAEIACCLGVSLSAAKVRTFRARIKLASILTQQ